MRASGVGQRVVRHEWGMLNTESAAFSHREGSKHGYGQVTGYRFRVTAWLQAGYGLRHGYRQDTGEKKLTPLRRGLRRLGG